MQMQRYKDASVARWSDTQDDPASASASEPTLIVDDDGGSTTASASATSTDPQPFRKLKQLCPRGFKCKTLLPCPYRHPKRRF